MIQPQLKFLGMLFALSILTACGAKSSGGGGSTPAPTATLTANPTSFTVGHGASMLSFTSTNATQGSIDNGEGPVGANGSVQVQPATTTTYTFTATGPGGSAIAQATVTVTPLGPAPTISLSADSTAIVAGQAVTLTWNSTNATNVAIEPAPGGVALSGTGTVFPTPPSITYTATATGNFQQTTANVTVEASALTSFDGMPEDSSNLGSTDIDPNGAVGTLQYMEYVNIEYQAYDKETHLPVWSTPQQIGTPWKAPLNTAGNVALPDCDGAPDGTGNPSGIQLDTVINFDRLASRWVIGAKATFANHYYFCIAVSNTDDLSSSSLGWYAYVFTMDLGPNAQGHFYFPDWPKLGTWTDSYWTTIDLQDKDNSFAEVGVAICAFDRTNMLKGAIQSTTPGPPLCITVQTPIDPTSGTYLAHSVIPADIEGTTPPPSGRDEFMVSIENPTVSLGAAGTSNYINLWDLKPVDWTANPPSLTLSRTTPSVATYTPGCYFFSGSSPVQTNCVPENPGNQHIDSVGDRLMPRFAYRNFGTYESFLVSHTVQTNSTTQNPLQTGVRWYELRDNGTGAPSIFQYGLISPDDTFFRFLPSIAQDKNGNAAVGYSVSNSFTNPAIDFVHWSLGTPNATTDELSIINGAGEEITGGAGYGQWGTYSSMTIDPLDDCTFWYVNEYWPTTTNWATRIANFKIPGCQ